MSENIKRAYDKFRRAKTQRVIANKLGISQTYLSLIINEKRIPRPELMDRIKKVIGLKDA